ncbi:MAG: NUDIX hydrolase [Candidatus Jordarchaeaceae archaeon]
MKNFKNDWKTIKINYAYKAQAPDEISLRVDEVRFPSGRVGRYVYAEYPFEVCFILPVDDDGRLLFIQQYRYPLDKELIEIPAGSPLPGETLEECACRETEEETGFRPREIRHVLTFYPSPGSSDMKAHLFIARGLESTKRTQNVDEYTNTLFLTQPEAEHLIMDGQIQHIGAVLGVLILKKFSIKEK